MRKAKDNAGVPTRYFRPDFQYCPLCGAPLRRKATVQDKVLITLGGRFRLISRGYCCSRAGCRNAGATFVSAEPARLSLKGLSFGFDAIVQIGWWRFWEHRTLDEIWELARQRFPISRRQVMYLVVDFLCLLRAAQPARIEGHRSFYAQHGLLLSVDAMQPEKGNDVLYVVRELQLDLTLQAVKVSNQRAATIRTQVLEPVRALGFPVRGIVSDAEDALRRACQETWPGCPHQVCHFHTLRDAGKPIFDADQAVMVKLKRDLRLKLRPLRRAIEQLDEADPHRPILQDYAEALRSCLRVGSVAPFQLGGLRVLDDLRAVAASLRRCQKKPTIPCCKSCWLPPRYTVTTWLLVAACAVSWAGWLNWRITCAWTMKPVNHVKPGKSNERSKPSWYSWNKTPQVTLQRPSWPGI
jgi:hypothetical protein